MLSWLRRRRQAARLAQVDAEALIHDHGGEACSEARQRERDMILPDGTTQRDLPACACAIDCAMARPNL